MEHRQKVYDILRKMRYDVIATEDSVATDERPVDKCLADVASCDLYIGIFAWRYGCIPEQTSPAEVNRIPVLLMMRIPWRKGMFWQQKSASETLIV